jgi:hypothetical protein
MGHAIAWQGGSVMWTRGTPSRHSLYGPAVVLVLATAAGCGSRQAYPKLWPALDRSSSCEQLTGTYRDEGTSGSSDSVSLSMLLIEGVIRSQAPPSVTLSFTPEQQLRVRLDDRSGTGSTFTIAREQFSCEKGRIVLHKGSRWAGAGPTYGLFSIGKVSTAVELYRAADYLIVKKRARSIGVVVVIPWTSKTEEWHRFQRLPTE